MSINPATWMTDLSEQIGSKPLNEIVIPGTHDSGTYGITKDSAESPDDPAKVRAIRQVLQHIPCLSASVDYVLAVWARAQGLNFTQQFEAGIRYYDLRAIWRDNAELWIAHGMYSTPLFSALGQLQPHANDTSHKEIFILDFNHFFDAVGSGGMPIEGHEKLIGWLAENFSNSAPNSLSPMSSFNDFIERGSRVIILYKDIPDSLQNATLNNFRVNHLWNQSQIQSNWPNVQSLGDLKSKMTTYLSDRPTGEFFVEQGIETDNDTMIAQGFVPSGEYPMGLYQLAKQVTPAVTQWLDSGDLGTKPMNIVIADWFQCADFAQTLINLNNN